MKRTTKIENSAAVNNNSKNVSKKGKDMKSKNNEKVAPKAKEAKAKTVGKKAVATPVVEEPKKRTRKVKAEAVATPVVEEPKKRTRKVKAEAVATPAPTAKVIDMKERRERRSMKALESVVEGMKKVKDPKQAKKFMKKYSDEVGVETAERNVRFILHKLDDVTLNSIFLALAVPAKKAA